MGSKDIQFETVEDAVIAVGETSVDVTARAIETGRRFNVLPDKVDTIVNPPKYISGVVNNTAFAGGTDDETDESLRDRVLEIYKWENNALNEAAVKKMVLRQCLSKATPTMCPYRAPTSAITGTSRPSAHRRSCRLCRTSLASTPRGSLPAAAANTIPLPPTTRLKDASATVARR